MSEDDPLRAWIEHPWQVFRRAAWPVGLGLVVLVVAVVVVQREASAEGVEGLWHRIRWGPMALAWSLLAASVAATGLRWRELWPPGVRPPVRELATIQCAGTLLGYAVPGPVGEIASAWLAHQRYGVGLAESLASSLAARVLGFATAALLSLATWAIFDLPVHGLLRAPVALVAVGLGAGGFVGFVVAACPDAVHARISRVLDPLSGPGPVGRAAAAIARALGAVTAAIAGVTRRGLGPWLRAAAWAMAGHAVVAAAFAVSAWSIGALGSLPGILFAYAAVTSGGMVLYAAPGSQVASDALLVGLFVGTAGLVLPDAVAVAFLLRVQSASVLFLGSAGLLWAHRPTPANGAL